MAHPSSARYRYAYLYQAGRFQNAAVTALAVLLAYLLGSVSFPALIARRSGIDLRRAGSRKLGGGNLYRTVGPAAGISGGVLDGAKGSAAVLLARGDGLPLEIQLACGAAAIVGQLWPVFHRFDGGRANATGWGFALAADPVAALIMAIPIASGLVLRELSRPRSTRLMPMAALLSFFVWPAAIWESEGLTPTVVAGLVVLALIVVRRLTAGIRADLETGAPLARIVANRVLYDRSELQERGLVAI